MKNRTISSILLSFAMLQFSINGYANEKTKTPSYVVVQVQVEDKRMFFNDYGKPALESIKKNGGKVLSASFNQEVLEGVWNSNWNVILQFPSKAITKSWYNSPEYQAVKHYRTSSTQHTNMVILDGKPQTNKR